MLKAGVPTESQPEQQVKWIDSHCHLQFDDFDEGTVIRAVEAGVDKMIVVGTDAETSQRAVDIAVEAGERMRAVVGLHPHDAKNEIASTIGVLESAIANHDGVVVGVGECGLDYFYEHSAREKQQEVFAQQIELAKQYGLTLVVHTRDAWDDTFAILRNVGAPPLTVIHCFTGGIEEAKKSLDLGFYLSFSGITTFKNAVNVQEAAAFCPLDRMTIETDSPFLAPVPFRGKPNQPAFVGVVGEFISKIKNMKEDHFAAEIYASTVRAFNL